MLRQVMELAVAEFALAEVREKLIEAEYELGRTDGRLESR